MEIEKDNSTQLSTIGTLGLEIPSETFGGKSPVISIACVVLILGSIIISIFWIARVKNKKEISVNRKSKSLNRPDINMKDLQKACHQLRESVTGYHPNEEIAVKVEKLNDQSVNPNKNNPK